MGLGVLPHQNLSYAIGRHLLPWASVVSALNQREPHFSQQMPRPLRFLCQATPEQISHDVFEPAALIRRPNLGRADQLIGELERRLQTPAILP